jgi:hypothetical protein
MKEGARKKEKEGERVKEGKIKEGKTDKGKRQGEKGNNDRLRKRQGESWKER